MKNGNTTIPGIEQLLAAHTPAVQGLAEALREHILAAAPAAQERVHPGWHAIGYTDPICGYFCAIFPREAGVRLGFEFGALLDDPDRLLSGSGKQVRYVELTPGTALPSAAIDRLIQAALDLPPRRADKLAMLAAAQPARKRRP